MYEKNRNDYQSVAYLLDMNLYTVHLEKEYKMTGNRKENNKSIVRTFEFGLDFQLCNDIQCHFVLNYVRRPLNKNNSNNKRKSNI